MDRLTWMVAGALLGSLGLLGCGGDGDTGGEVDRDGGRLLDSGGGGDEDGGGTSAPTRIERYLRGDAADRLVLEVDAVDGLGPSDEVASQLMAGLEDVLDKPGGIEMVRDGTLEARGEGHTWNREELFGLGDDSFDLSVPEDTVKMHVMFVDGEWGESTDGGQTLGLAWGHTHIAIFKDAIEDVCSGGLLGPVREQLLCRNAEVSIWTHEVGHNLGLVNNGLPMVEDHEDAEHVHHDASDACVMYWAYEGETAVTRLQNRIMGGNEAALGFDAACEADLAAVRDR